MMRNSRTKNFYGLLIAAAQPKSPNRRKCNHKCLLCIFECRIMQENRKRKKCKVKGKGRKRKEKDVKKYEPDHRNRHQFPDGRRKKEDQIYLSASFTPISQQSIRKGHSTIAYLSPILHHATACLTSSWGQKNMPIDDECGNEKSWKLTIK
ncbi:unnamed protein product [Onchocerca flexuosa]|uniref:Ovule protein n=1 Tax=Onchocerca flexuosa TaxID=387005 RepID=A0A183HBI8_9BILA|nr:unnamed protein product [Onchocerca flexuosa]